MQVICHEEDAFTSGWPTGWSVRHKKSSFEVVGVPHEVIDHFTKRTNEIGQIAEEKGITDAKALDTLGARTRTSKQKAWAWKNCAKTGNSRYGNWKRAVALQTGWNTTRHYVTRGDTKASRKPV